MIDDEQKLMPLHRTLVYITGMTRETAALHTLAGTESMQRHACLPNSTKPAGRLPSSPSQAGRREPHHALRAAPTVRTRSACAHSARPTALLLASLRDTGTGSSAT